MLKLCSWLLITCVSFSQMGCTAFESPVTLKAPREDFLVGMWTTDGGFPIDARKRNYLVFRSDGTGRFKGYQSYGSKTDELLGHRYRGIFLKCRGTTQGMEFGRRDIPGREALL